jgi:hypothetical protein
MSQMDQLQNDLCQAATDLDAARAEVARLRAAIEIHRDQKGDDRCWLDDLALYSAIGEPNAVQRLPPKCEFLKSCDRYWEQRQSPLDKPVRAGDMTIGQLEREIDRYRRWLKIATELYAHHVKISPDEAQENIRDADAIKRGVQ